MKVLLRFLVLVLMVSFGAVISSQAEEPAKAPAPDASAAPKGPRTITGDILMIEGEYYVVKDVTGHETRVHVNKDTKLEDKLKVKVGDKVEVHVTGEGHAESMKLQIPDSGKAGKP